MLRIQNKLDKAAKCLEYFSTQEWRFLDDNVRELNASLSLEDRRLFSFDVTEIDWPKYIADYVLGIRSFIFKEQVSSLPQARKRLYKMLWIHRLSKLLLVLLMWRMLMLRSRVARSSWHFFIDLVLRLHRLIPFTQ